MRQATNQRPADFLRAQGWDVIGTVLRGEPIWRGSHQVERGFEAKVTAVGEGAVLARTRMIYLDTENQPALGQWGSEHSVTFDYREWSLDAPSDSGAS